MEESKGHKRQFAEIGGNNEEEIEYEGSSSSEEEGMDMNTQFQTPNPTSLPPNTNTQEEIQLNLEFIDMDKKHWSGVRKYLLGFLEETEYNIGELADLITSQGCIGSVITNDAEVPMDVPGHKELAMSAEDEENKDIFAFITVLPAKVFRENHTFNSVLGYFKGKGNELLMGEQAELFSNIIDNHRFGLLINERLVNFSFEAIPPLHQMLKEDIEWTLTESEVENKDDYICQYLLFVSKVCRASPNSNKILKKKGNKIHKRLKEEIGPFVYYKFEDQYLLSESEMWFSYIIEEKEKSGTKAKQTVERIVGLIEYEKYIKIVERLPKLI